MDTREPNEQAFLEELHAALASASVVDALSGGSADALLDKIVRAAARAIPCPEGALFLIDRQRQVLTFEVVIGSTAATVKDLTVPLGHGIAGLVAASGQALAIANAQDDPRHARDVAEQSGYLPTTILAVPVAGADGVPIGVLELLDREGQPTFSLADMDLLGLFAEQVALVLQMRRSDDLLASRLGSALATLGVPADARARLLERVDALDARTASDPATKGLVDLADLVASIAGRGEAEQEMCTRILRSVSSYLETTPSLGMGMFR